MKVTGGATVHAPVAAVWTALSDPAVLVRAIPGCERLTATAPDTYELTVTAGVGTITGTYTGQIALTDQQPPTGLTLRANGSGTPGTVTTSVLVRLSDDGDGATVLSYDADATVGGLIAGVGQRMLAGVARRQATQFFTALDTLLLAEAEAAAERAAGTGLESPPAAAAATVGEWPGDMGAEPVAAAERGRQSAGAAGVSSATEPPARPATGRTWERPPMKGRQAAAPHLSDFAQGAVAGAVIALAGVIVGGLIARRKR